MFLGLLDPDPLVRGMDWDPYTSITKPRKKSKENLDSYFLSLNNYVDVLSKSNKQKNFF
jgi:hypothetical protein